MIAKRHFKVKKNGTAAYYCYCTKPELIENYDKAIADTDHMWDCHHRLETHTSDGERRFIDLSQAELITLGIYFDRPPEELIFLTKSEHKSLHLSEETKRKLSKMNKGRHHSEEAKKKISEARKGSHHSVETCRRISDGNKGKRLSEETKKKMSDVNKGKNDWSKNLKWYNNGVKNVRAFECPKDFIPGQLRH